MESTTYMVAGQTFELQHYGVKGMKWGVRKAQTEYAKLDKLKKDYKKAKREYNKAYNQASGFKNYGSFSPIKKHRQASQERWENAMNKAQKLNAAKKAYKEQKKEVRKNTTIGQKIGRTAPKVISKTLTAVGSFYVTDVMLTGGATTRAIVKTGKAAVKSAMSTIGDKVFDYALLDAAGNVLKRYN